MNSRTTQTQPPNAADEDAIRAIHQRMIDAWNAGDYVAFAAPFTDDADFVTSEGSHLKGRDEIISFAQHNLDVLMKGSRMEGEVEFVQLLSPMWALMRSVVRTTLNGQTASSPERATTQLSHVAKRNGEWRIEGFNECPEIDDETETLNGRC